MSTRNINLVLAGDYAQDKCLLLNCLYYKIPWAACRRLGWSDYAGRMEVDGVTVDLGCLCLEITRRYQTHPPRDVAIIYFNNKSQISIKKVTSKWYPYIKKFYGKIPIILVGIRLDSRLIRQDRLMRYLNLPIDAAQGEALAVSINAIKYFEISIDVYEDIIGFEEYQSSQTKILGEAVRAVFRRDQEKIDEEKKKEEDKNKIKRKMRYILRSVFMLPVLHWKVLRKTAP